MDVPVGLWLSVFGAMVVVGGLVAVRVARAGGVGIAVALGVWLAVDIGLATAGVFAADHDTLVPVIAFGIVVPIAAGGWLLLHHRGVAEVADRLPLPWLIGVQLFRVVGVLFLVAWALDLMPAEFALPAGLGDVAVGLAAPFVARRVARDPVGGRRAAIAWNVAGLLDFVVAVTVGFLTSPSRFQQLAESAPNFPVTRMPFVLVPVFGVPLAALLHVVALRRLTSSAKHAHGGGGEGLQGGPIAARSRS
ncbi:MAG TPA: hypothetical protein VF244_10710 [Acidimicrobiales bacterium]